MPLPLVLGGAASWLGRGGLAGIAGTFGISEQRLRSPAQNRAARQTQIAEAMTMARQGKRLGVQLLLQWSGQLPDLTVRDPQYRNGTPQGRMPSDGVAGALSALETLRSEGTLVGTKLYAGKGDADIEGARQGVRSAAKEKAFAEAFLEDVGTSSSSRKKKAKGGRASAESEDASTRGSGRKVTRYAPPDWRKRRVPEDSEAADTWPERLVSRYDPDTGRKRRVPEIDPYDQWPSTKAEWRRGGGVLTQLTGGRGGARGSSAMVNTISRRISDAGLDATPGLVEKFAAMAAQQGLTPVKAAALVVAAGVASYAVTRYVIDQIDRARDPAVKREKIALEYRASRQRLATKLGHSPSAGEQKVLAEWFKQRMRDAGFGSYLRGI